MKAFTLITIFFTSIVCFSQTEINRELESIEKAIKLGSPTGEFSKLEIDLDNDNDLDYIYLYQCAEPNCIQVYLNINQELKKVISEFCYDYYLYNNGLKELIIKLNHCCGESPFTSVRTFNFNEDNYSLESNYVIANSSNFGHRFFSPEVLLEKSYNIKIINQNYNIRFSPNIERYDDDSSMFSCEPNTNIIGKLKKDSKIKVLSELIQEKRLWLFVEVDNNNLNRNLCKSPLDFDYKNQKLRGWVSGNFVEKLKN